MSWRPEGWEDHTGEGWEEIYGEAFEAGADAMLESLKKEGKYIDASKYPYGFILNDIVPVQKIECNFKGWLIIIPKEVD